MGIQSRRAIQPRPKRGAARPPGPPSIRELSPLPAEKPHYVEPMKARLVSTLPDGDEWLYELKLDGIRAIAVKDGKTVRLFSRLPREVTSEYPGIVSALQVLPVSSLVVDGEIAALNAKGLTSFQLLQNRRRSSSPTNILFYLFDLLHLNGRNLRDVPLTRRREVLETFLKKPPAPLRLSAILDQPATIVWKEISRLGLEGAIAKRRDSNYEPGRRSGAWVKVKSQKEQEFVIGGCTPPEGSRKYFGAILVGYYRGRDLIFASRVGTGFDHATLKSLFTQFQANKSATCPFANLPTRRSGRFGQGVTAADMSRCLWIKPRLVCQIRFQEWTADDSLRQPVFLGLRKDKAPSDVVRETPEE